MIMWPQHLLNLANHRLLACRSRMESVQKLSAQGLNLGLPPHLSVVLPSRYQIRVLSVDQRMCGL